MLYQSEEAYRSDTAFYTKERNMFTARIFETIDKSCDNIIESLLEPDEFKLFNHLFIRKHMVKLDIEVYCNDTLIFTGSVGEFLNYLLNCFKEDLEKEMY